MSPVGAAQHAGPVEHGVVVEDPVADEHAGAADQAGAGHRARRRGARRLPGQLLVLLVRAWQLVVSPWYPPVCRFYPSCSTYAVRAIEEHGAVRGAGLAARRLLRCHPWNPGGVDHVPPRGSPRTTGGGTG